jgi:hypothetical protein
MVLSRVALTNHGLPVRNMEQQHGATWSNMEQHGVNMEHGAAMLGTSDLSHSAHSSTGPVEVVINY